MKQYRVTKYNPKYRDGDGVYIHDEWTSYSDIGKTVPKSEYERIENAYIESARLFLKEQGISQITVEYLENSQNYIEPDLPLVTGTILNLDELKKVLKGILRERYWAKLSTKNSFLHFGYDYYMYIGVPNEPKRAIKFAESLGLFVEDFPSPYKIQEL